ncbi:MAG: GNAT family N-acetyltransferase [Chloroflexota bacterium]
MGFTIRPATTDDIPTLSELIRSSTRSLSRNDYSDEQIETALQGTMGVDSNLIRDRTYFVVEADSVLETGGRIVACGGWSRRKALLGTDSLPGHEASLLNPSCDAAKVRAFFVHPAWVRQGIGRLLLAHCEAEARAHGFSAVELMATLPGQRLYRVCGYVPSSPVQYPLTMTLTMQLVPMRKELVGTAVSAAAHGR